MGKTRVLRFCKHVKIVFENTTCVEPMYGRKKLNFGKSLIVTRSARQGVTLILGYSEILYLIGMD